ncbi:MAG: DUF2336 domain-containing protein, partial [Alphaproteobacteria bacterium]|nr:DUF2336 domain-containing protein [Alphaproteobacteria bacterium]
GMSGAGSISPMLVELYDSHKQYAQDPENHSHSREIVCGQMTDLLSVASRVADREMVTDVLVTLLRQSEKELKSALAERLALLPNVPLRLLLQLLNEDIAVARPIILNSPVLNDLDLLYIIQSRDTTFWQTIAARRFIKENVVDALATTHDVPTAKVLVENETITLTDFSLHELEELAMQNEELAKPLLLRSDVPESVARKIHEYVSRDLKDFTSSQFGSTVSDADQKEVEDVINDVLNEFVTPRMSGDSFMPTAAMLRAADMFMQQGKLDVTLMVRTLKRGQISSFIAQMSVFSNLNPSVVVSLLKQHNGQGLAIVARACEISNEDFMSMFMLTRRMVNTDGVVSSDNIGKAQSYYNRINSYLAKKILKRSQH